MALLKTPILCLVTDRQACLGRPLEEVVLEAVEGGVGMVQLRDKESGAGALLEMGRRLHPELRCRGAALVVNDRVDVVLALGADGVQLGHRSLPVAEVRRLAGPSMVIGASVHSLEEARKAESEGADYLVLGTVFETASHPGTPAGGPALVAEVAAEVRVPIIAIGGINRGNAFSVMGAGASGIAVIRGILSASQVREAAEGLLHAIGGDPSSGISPKAYDGLRL